MKNYSAEKRHSLHQFAHPSLGARWLWPIPSLGVERRQEGSSDDDPSLRRFRMLFYIFVFIPITYNYNTIYAVELMSDSKYL
jgi:hypothetical protein